MAYTIRFRPADPADVSQALYLSNGRGQLTSVADDLWTAAEKPSTRFAQWMASAPVIRRQRLVADVVSLAEALADLEAP